MWEDCFAGSVHFIWPVYSTSSFIVNKLDCVPGNTKIKLLISKDKGEYQESSQSQTGVQRMHCLLHSKQGWCSNCLHLPTAQQARMHEATEPCSGIRRWRRNWRRTYLKRLLSGNRRSRSKQQTDVNFLESSEPTAHVQ